MQWNIHEEKWSAYYNLAKAYYEHHGNLEIPGNFKTINGYEYDENGIKLGNWISNQKKAYNGKEKSKITTERIKLLESIGMKWFLSEKKDDKLQSEIIDEKNVLSKQQEIANRVHSYLNKQDGSSLPSKEDLNQGLLDEFNHVSKK